MTSAEQPPRVSVIVPTRNRPELLRRALASILSQDYAGEIECVVVFDQSEPHPIEIDVPEGRWVRPVVNDRTPGPGGARNAGILTSTGDLIGFCDDDDEWLRDKVRLQAEALRACGRGLVGCGTLVWRGGREFRRLPPTSELTFDDLLRSRHMELHLGTILARRSVFLELVGLVDESMPGGYAEDYEWLLRAARTAPLFVLPDALARVHWNRRSWFDGRWGMLADALRYLLRKYPEFARHSGGLARLYGQIAVALAAAGRPAEACSYAWRAWRLDPRQPRPYLALLVASRLLRVNDVMRAAAALGRGI